MNNKQNNYRLYFLITLIVVGGVLVLLLILWFIMWILQYFYKKNNPNWEMEMAQLEKEKEMNKTILIVGSDGFEDVELILPRDIWMRLGYDVDIAFGTSNKYVVSGKGLEIKVKLTLKDVLESGLSKYDALFIPGGPGFKTLNACVELDPIIAHFVDNNKLVGAICAGPTALAKRGYLKGKTAICHYGDEWRNALIDGGATLSDPNCKPGQDCQTVVDGNFVTSLTMETAFSLAYTFAEELEKR